MLSKHYRIILFLLVCFTFGEVPAFAPRERMMGIEMAKKNLSFLKNGLNRNQPYTELQVIKAEEMADLIPASTNKIKIY